MKQFAKVPRPTGFQTDVLKKGRQWLKQPTNRAKKRPKDYWSPYRDNLMRGFDELCGYTVMWTPNGTVDHYIPWTTVREHDARIWPINGTTFVIQSNGSTEIDERQRFLTHFSFKTIGSNFYYRLWNSLLPQMCLRPRSSASTTHWSGLEKGIE